MNLKLLRKLAQVWLRSLKNSSERLNLKKGNEVNTFATTILGYEGYYVQQDLFVKLAEDIENTEEANGDRKPGYLILPAFPGSGKTRTTGFFILMAMLNKLKELLKTNLNEIYHEKLDQAFGLMFTFNDKMIDSLMKHDSFKTFKKLFGDIKIDEIDLVARFAFW